MSTDKFVECPTCQRPRRKVLGAFQHTEDRTHMWKGPLGNGYSHALGERMPDSRQERDRLAKKKGVEFIGLAEHLAENKEAAEAVAYHREVQAGGPRELPRPNPAAAAAWKSHPDWAKHERR